MKEIRRIIKHQKTSALKMKNYEKQMPENRLACHLAMKKIMALPKMTVTKVARFLEVDRGKVYRILYGNDVDQLPQRWSAEETKILKQIYLKMPYREVAEILNRSPRAINDRIRNLGLRKRFI